MKPTASSAAPRAFTPASLSGSSLRASRSLRWLGHRSSYVIGVPVVSLLGLLTTLYIPRLISPSEFGAYALLLNVYRYAGRGDLGLSQLADRLLAANANAEKDQADDILNARFRLGLLVLCVVLPGTALIVGAVGRISVVDTSLALAAGACAMMAAGPSSIHRAQGHIWEYTALSFLFSFGFMLPRLLGLYVGGITGCFAMLLIWYGSIAALFTWHFARRTRAPSPQMRLLATLRSALPLFFFVAVSTLYLSLNQWICAALSSASDLGLFCLGANLSLACVTTLIAISDVRYPRWLHRLARTPRGAESGPIEREGILMAGALAGGVAMFIPFAAPITAAAFPAYEGAAPVIVAFAVTSIPLATAFWFLPIVIATAPSPRRTAAIVFLPAAAILVVGMGLGQRLGGVQGQAWGCCASSIGVLAGLAAAMWTSGILRLNSALRFVALPALFLLPLIGLAVAGPIQPPTMTLGSGTEAQDEVPPKGWRLAFEDRFETLRLWDGRQGIWEPRFPWGGRTDPTANDMEYYADPRPQHEVQPLLALNPFTTGKDGLTITARPIPIGDRAWVKHLAYASGLLNSSHGFTFTYGYIEIRASLPRGRGLWPAFWLLPVDRTWPPEIDVFEVIGSEERQFWATVHTAPGNTFAQARIETDDLYERMHTYGVRWDAREIVWYFDGRRVAATTTPPDLHQPMYMLLNLAVGGAWPGPPDATTHLPAVMKVGDVRVYQATGPVVSTSEGQPR